MQSYDGSGKSSGQSTRVSHLMTEVHERQKRRNNVASIKPAWLQAGFVIYEKVWAFSIEKDVLRSPTKLVMTSQNPLQVVAAVPPQLLTEKQSRNVDKTGPVTHYSLKNERKEISQSIELKNCLPVQRSL